MNIKNQPHTNSELLLSLDKLSTQEEVLSDSASLEILSLTEGAISANSNLQDLKRAIEIFENLQPRSKSFGTIGEKIATIVQTILAWKANASSFKL